MLTQPKEYDIIVYTVDDIQHILSLGRNRAYALMRSNGFPSFRLNHKIMVTKDNFEKWLRQNVNKTYVY